MNESTVVKFRFENASNPTMKEKVIDTPAPELIDMTIGTVMEINFENDAYYADFKIKNKQVDVMTNNEGEEIKEYIYVLEYVPRTTRTKTEHDLAQEEIQAKKDLANLLNP